MTDDFPKRKTAIEDIGRVNSVSDMVPRKIIQVRKRNL